ncbi:uncharacterized protein LOC129570399 isoform X2 [Sitodiplosis mosellana]|uniref:uncharacterized protein LOC129570399 isoform X2 n=1 Tax=Sitodiplosis mosellana TaxID=263140 RepID=UPI0024445497|nr:uncharacterized protein LOC129570399 isoform X2 [Sitodiplosis mosellana]
MNDVINQLIIQKYLTQIQNLTLKSLVELKAHCVQFDGNFEAEFHRLTNDCVAQTYRDFMNDIQQGKTPNYSCELNYQDGFERNVGVDSDPNEESHDTIERSRLCSNNTASSSVSKKFACVICQDARAQTQYSSIENIHAHWEAEHNDGQLFQFYVVEPVVHFLQKTSTEPSISRVLLIVSQLDQCIGYIRSNHQEVMRCEMISPFRFTDDHLNELLKINFNHDHTNRDAIYDPVDQELPQPCSILFVVCSYCQSKVDGNQFMLHVREHVRNVRCMECNLQVGTLADLFLHDEKVHGINSTTTIELHCSEFVAQSEQTFQNSKVVFANGLVLHNLNLVGTGYDKSSAHSAFIQVLIDLEMAKYRKLCQPKCLDTKGRSEDSSDATEVIDQNEVNSNHQVLQSIENHPTVPPQPNSYAMELKKQNEISKILMIRGIPELNNENLTEIFMALCKKVNAKVDADDILGIERCDTRRGTIIVKLKHLKDKRTVRKLAKDLWSNDVVKLPPKVVKTKVYVYSQLTEFFNKILEIAKSACAQGALHSYQLTKDGVIVKRTPESIGQIVLSKKQLEDYIRS